MPHPRKYSRPGWTGLAATRLGAGRPCLWQEGLEPAGRESPQQCPAIPIDPSRSAMSRAELQRPEPRARPRPAPPPAARPLWRAAGAPQRPQRRTAPASAAAAAAPRGTQRAPLRSSPLRTATRPCRRSPPSPALPWPAVRPRQAYLPRRGRHGDAHSPRNCIPFSPSAWLPTHPRALWRGDSGGCVADKLNFFFTMPQRLALPVGCGRGARCLACPCRSAAAHLPSSGRGQRRSCLSCLPGGTARGCP